MLPAHQRVLEKIAYIIGRNVRRTLNKNPPHVSEEKTALNVVGIGLLVHETVMLPVVRGPLQYGVLARSRSEKQKKKLYRTTDIVGAMGEKTMVPACDGKTGGG
jgi:hypothetical protein